MAALPTPRPHASVRYQQRTSASMSGIGGDRDSSGPAVLGGTPGSNGAAGRGAGGGGSWPHSRLGGFRSPPLATIPATDGIAASVGVDGCRPLALHQQPIGVGSRRWGANLRRKSPRECVLIRFDAHRRAHGRAPSGTHSPRFESQTLFTGGDGCCLGGLGGLGGLCGKVPLGGFPIGLSGLTVPTVPTIPEPEW